MKIEYNCMSIEFKRFVITFCKNGYLMQILKDKFNIIDLSFEFDKSKFGFEIDFKQEGGGDLISANECSEYIKAFFDGVYSIFIYPPFLQKGNMINKLDVVQPG